MAKNSERRPRRVSTPPKNNSRRLLVVAAIVVFILISMGGLAWIRSGPDDPVKSASSDNPPPVESTPRTATRVDYEVVNSYPHDPTAFLQGLVWHDGGFYESTGLEGKSTLRRVEFPSGRVAKMVRLDPDLFGEGLALVGDRLIQLTWTTGKGLVYDRESLNKISEFTYDTEGWGLAFDGRNLILSDGSNVLTYLDPQTFKPVKKLAVTMNGRPARQLNELEFIEGEIWANVWQTDRIVRIDPASGQVTSYLDLRDILPAQMRRGGEDVLNGIAYDPVKKHIFVSGKLWPRLFEIRLK